MLRRDRAGHRIHLGPRGGDGDAWLQARGRIEHPRPALFRDWLSASCNRVPRERDPQLRPSREREPERRRRDADNRILFSVDRDRSADEALIRAEVPGPQLVTENDGARSRLLLDREKTAAERAFSTCTQYAAMVLLTARRCAWPRRTRWICVSA
jgi:hypothetical protein